MDCIPLDTTIGRPEHTQASEVCIKKM